MGQQALQLASMTTQRVIHLGDPQLTLQRASMRAQRALF